MSQLKQILRLLQQSYPLKAIQRQTGVARNTIKGYIRNLESKEITIENALTLDDLQLDQLLRAPTKYEAERHQEFLARLDYFQQELSRAHVTKQVLWEEYKRDNPQGYQYSRFCYYLHLNDRSQRAVLSRDHQPGEKLFIDFSGDKLSYVDPSTGQIIPCEIFISTLGYSNFTAVVAVHSQKLEDVIYACTKVLEQIGGCAKAIVPDNLKAAVTKSDKYEPRINDVFMDMANHYGMVVLPARPYKPKDKAKVEVSVRIIYQRVFAPLRKMVFHSLEELNQAIAEQVHLLNNRIMQQYGCSRALMLDRDERSVLLPLPVHAYELKRQMTLKVQDNCHVYISSLKKYYSAPYQYIGEKLQVIITATLVRLYFKGNCVATHTTDTNTKYNYVPEHLPSHHQIVLKNMNVALLLERAAAINEKVKQVLEIVLKRTRHPELAYKSCMGILSLASRASKEVLIESCEIALNYNVCTYTHLTRIATGKYANRSNVHKPSHTPLPLHENIRGASNYAD